MLDLAHGSAEHLLPEYRGEVARLELLDLGITQPDGADGLYVGHPVSLTARVLV